MRNIQHRLLRILLLTLLFTFIQTPISVSAEENNIEIIGKYYERCEKYQFDNDLPTGTTDKYKALGKLELSGNIQQVDSDKKISEFEVEENKGFTISYSYTDSLLNASKDDWHLISDNNDTINNIPLNEKIGNAAFVLQTSLDGTKWITADIKADLVHSSDKYIFTVFDDSASVQLLNGCYYRIIIAYKTEMKIGSDIVERNDTSENVEVYKFYVKSPNNGNIVSGKQYNYNTIDYTQKTKSNDYLGSQTITPNDPHFGWSLGEFCLNGYTDTGDTNDIYIKKIGNKIRLSFKLEQDINCLDGNSKLIIANDKNGCDGMFQKTKRHNMEHGELIVKYTDAEGHSTIREYSNYLEALTSPNADTTIQLFEEGDYEIHLDYAITDQNSFPDKTTYYRTSFSFKIRNSNCMIFLFDSKTGNELSNGDVTENGFRIDAANSKYLKAHIKKEYLNDSKTGLKEDTRSNSVAADGEIFTEEGIYTITANNQYDKYCDPTVKTIYIGQNHILAAYTKYLNTPKPYTIEELNTMIDKGYTINANGEIIEPVTTTTTTTTTTTSTTETTMVTTSELPKQETTNTSTSTTLQNQTDDKKSTLPYIGGGIAGFAAISGLVLLYFKNKKKIR